MIETRPAWAEVNLDNLAHNIKEVKKVVKAGTAIMAAVKADAYGHGSIYSSQTFLENGASWLGVATLSEGLELRRADVYAPILILGYTPEYQFQDLVDNRVSTALYNLEHARALSVKALKIGIDAGAHIKVDTGMGRLGFISSRESIDHIVEVSRLEGIKLEGIFTHFAVSEEADKAYSRMQFELFMDVVEKLESRGVSIPLRHVSNSGAIIDLPEYNLDMVRPGTMLYGIYPSEDVDKSKVDLRPAMTLKTRFSNVKTVPKGTGISYGLTFKTKRRSVIGTLPIGYADGLKRALSNRGAIWFRGKRAPIVGRVCMDQCMVDLTDAPSAEMGDEVTVFGEGGDGAPLLREIAELAGTNEQEVLCSISRRVPRVYLRGGEVIGIKDYLLI